MDISSSDDEEDMSMTVALNRVETLRNFEIVAAGLGMFYAHNYLTKPARKEPKMSSYEWVMITLSDPTDSYEMCRMSRPLFDRLHDRPLLVSSYGLTGSRKMASIEALGMFLWTVGAPQSFVQVKNRFKRSKETISRKINEVLDCVYRMAKELVKPIYPNFTTPHPKLLSDRFAPHFNNCISAIDGTHILVIVPSSKVVQHVGRHGYLTQDVLGICDFDMRFTFVVVGWPRSVHDMRVFNDALHKYATIFPHPSSGTCILTQLKFFNLQI
jgi:hypothetical protein